MGLIILLGLVVGPLLGVWMIRRLDRRWSRKGKLTEYWRSRRTETLICFLAFFGGPILAEIVMVTSLLDDSAVSPLSRLIRWGAFLGCLGACVLCFALG